jgi:hypothetical protein
MKCCVRICIRIHIEKLGKDTVQPDKTNMRVVPLDSPSLGHQPLYILFYLSLILMFTVLIRLIQKYLQSSYFFADWL